MDHLKAEGGLFEEKEHGRQGKVMRPLRDIFHHAARVYLTFLYTDWHGKGKRTKLKTQLYCSILHLLCSSLLQLTPA